VALFDDELELVWEARDIIDVSDGAYTVGCAASEQKVFVYGLENPSVGQVGGELAAIGDAWIARLGL